MSLNLIDDKFTLVQVMAWCHQATSHYLSQCWPRSLPQYGVTRPQWVNTFRPEQNGHQSTTLQITFLNVFSSTKIAAFWFKFYWIPFLRVKINNKSALVQVMAWDLTSTKPFLEPILSKSAASPLMQSLRWQGSEGSSRSAVPPLHGPVYTPDNNRWDTPPV